MLDGKVALVTGTSRNIGGALASGLADAGATVACNDLLEETARERAELIEAAGGTAMAVPFDVTDEAAAAAGVEAVLERYGRIDILVNNAVKFDRGGLLDMAPARFRRQVDIILGGGFIVTQLVARSMVARNVRGAIVSILSTAAWQGEAGNIGYGTAKSGVINFIRSAAMELAPHGIRVNGLTPTATMPADGALAEQFRSAASAMASSGAMDFEGAHPWERLPSPDDYVGALVFLVSDQAALVTGTNLTVDGGALAKYWPQAPRRLTPPN